MIDLQTNCVQSSRLSNNKLTKSATEFIFSNERAPLIFAVILKAEKLLSWERSCQTVKFMDNFQLTFKYMMKMNNRYKVNPVPNTHCYKRLLQTTIDYCLLTTVFRLATILCNWTLSKFIFKQSNYKKDIVYFVSYCKSSVLWINAICI